MLPRRHYAAALPLGGRWCSWPGHVRQRRSHGEFCLGLNKQKNKQERKRILLHRGWTSALCDRNDTGCQAHSWNATAGRRARALGLILAPLGFYLTTSILGKLPLGKYREGQRGGGRLGQVLEAAWPIQADTKRLFHRFLAEIAGHQAVWVPCQGSAFPAAAPASTLLWLLPITQTDSLLTPLSTTFSTFRAIQMTIRNIQSCLINTRRTKGTEDGPDFSPELLLRLPSQLHLPEQTTSSVS